MPNTREKLIELLRKTRYEYRRYIGMKDMEKRMAKTDEEFLAIDDSIVGEIPFCADHLIANGVAVGKPLTEYLHPVDNYAGLKGKYLVFKADTGEQVSNCFVLRPDKDPAAVEALRAYANATSNETLADDIYNWVGKGVMEQEWIPVTERLPDLIPCNAGTAYSEAVIVWTDGSKAMIAVWDGIDFLCAADYWEAWGENITHWMPLPEPPKGE